MNRLIVDGLHTKNKRKTREKTSKNSISQPPGKRGESERMYKVMCRGSRRAWVDYSGKFETMEQAEECKERAEKRRTCDIHGKEIEYKIFAI